MLSHKMMLSQASSRCQTQAYDFSSILVEGRNRLDLHERDDFLRFTKKGGVAWTERGNRCQAVEPTLPPSNPRHRIVDGVLTE